MHWGTINLAKEKYRTGHHQGCRADLGGWRLQYSEEDNDSKVKFCYKFKNGFKKNNEIQEKELSYIAYKVCKILHRIPREWTKLLL